MNYIPSVVTRSIGHNTLLLRKHSPHIFFVGGLAGVITSTILACRATLKLDKVLTEFKQDVEDVKALKKPVGDSQYPTKQYSRDLAYVYGRGTYNLAKLYAPSIAVGTVSVALLTSSHVTLTKRNNALTATVVLLSQAFEEYRGRVREEIGQEKELDLYHGMSKELVKGEDGKEEEAKVIDPNQWSMYARFFDEYNANWQKNAEYNKIFIQVQQKYLNDMLIARGHVFLNEAYQVLGIPHSKAGAIVGWVMSKDSDNYIDIGIFDVRNKDFVNGYERSILLDFNVDGVIYDKI